MKNRRTERTIEKDKKKDENIKSAHREVFLACGEYMDVTI